MVSVLFSGLSGAGSMEQRSGTLHVSVVFLGKTLYSRVPLSTRVPAIFMLGVALAPMD